MMKKKKVEKKKRKMKTLFIYLIWDFFLNFDFTSPLPNPKSPHHIKFCISFWFFFITFSFFCLLFVFA